MKTLLFIFSIFFALISEAQIRFSASSDYSSVPISSRVKITYTLSGASAESFSRPSFDGFQLVGQSSYTGGGGMQIIVNGQVMKSNPGESRWEFTLIPSSVGKLTISPAKVQINGQIYNSNSITISVTSGGGAVATKGQAGVNSTQVPQSEPQKVQSIDGRDFFISAIPSKNTVWQGEQFTVSYRIYTRYDISQYGIEKTPSMDGFWIEELGDNKTAPKTWEENIDGKRYLVGEIRRVALIAQKNGKLIVPPLEIEAIVQIPNQQNQNPFSIFDQFFKDPFGSQGFDPFSSFGVKTEKRKIKSNTVFVNVNPLPEAGKPESFSGAVGSFHAKSELDRTKCFTGDGVVLRVDISGSGNLPLLAQTQPGVPDSFEWFDPDIKDNFTKTPNGISGTRSFEYLLQPSVPGNFEVKPQEFSFFDPTSGQYQSIILPEYSIKVLKGNNANVNAEKHLNKDIRHIDENGRNIFKNEFGFSFYYWLCALIIVLTAFAIMYFLRSKIRLKANVSEYRMRMAIKQAKQRLRIAKLALNNNEEEKFYSELSKAMWLYLTDKFGLPYSELSLSNAHETLLKSNIPSNIVRDFSFLLSECEYSRFAPTSGRMEKNELYNKTADLIIKVQTHATK